MEIVEVRRLLKQHVYYQSCSYEYAWNNYISEDIKKQYSFEEVMKQPF